MFSLNELFQLVKPTRTADDEINVPQWFEVADDEADEPPFQQGAYVLFSEGIWVFYGVCEYVTKYADNDEWWASVTYTGASGDALFMVLPVDYFQVVR